MSISARDFDPRTGGGGADLHAVPARTQTGPVDMVVDLTASIRSRELPAARRQAPLRHLYDVAGVVTVGSDVRLRELEYFRQPVLSHVPDIEIRVGRVGTMKPRKRTMVRQALARPVSVRYEEHLGRLGANFQLDMRDTIHVTVGPMFAASPHVLYTNVVEALLRFVAVSRGRVLLHSATVELNGEGVMLSARTDTGKTGTILRLLRDHGARFLADDMTILSPDGTAHCYPKPLTISAHTLRAVNQKALPLPKRAALALQSRLHSREGRSIGTWLGEQNIPIMALNAATQAIVPPPKYRVEQLVPCQIASSVQVQQLFVIERGAPELADLPMSEAIDILLENTDDAYGFPPFRYFAPAIVIGEDDYTALRTKEHEILSRALTAVRVRRMARDDFSWADAIPTLLAAERAEAETARDAS